MAKNVTKAPSPMMAMEMDTKNMEEKVKSSNYTNGAAYEAPMMNNQKRAAQKNLGNMPAPNGQGYN